MREIAIPIHLNFALDGEFTIVNLSEKIHDLEIEKEILVCFIEKYNDLIVTELCGEKYNRGELKKRFKRTGKSSRVIITMVGELELKVDKVKDTLTGKIFKPLFHVLGIGPKN